MVTTMEEQLYGFYQFPGLQKPLGRKIFSQFFWFQEMSLKREIFVLLASKIYDKIWHCFNIFCNFCVSENFNMSAVYASMSYNFGTAVRDWSQTEVAQRSEGSLGRWRMSQIEVNK